MKIELLVNGTLMFAHDAPSAREWQWQAKYNSAVEVLTMLLREPDLPPKARERIEAWMDKNEPLKDPQ